MFLSYPTYPKFRTLGLFHPQQQGEDVYALQTALNECDFPCGVADGILGPLTAQAIKDYQKFVSLFADGLAGGATQRSLALRIAAKVCSVRVVPVSAPRGQLELESGFRLGIYSPQRPDGSFDAGVTQRNTKFTLPQEGFDAQKSIDALVANTRKFFDLFEGVQTLTRRWALAQGSWNAPAFACYIAREEGATKVSANMTAHPSDVSRATFEDYVRMASVYLNV